MTILVDAAIWPHRGRRWAHLVSDDSHAELHAFAARLGVPRRAFQGDHYDVPAVVREQAIALGAEPVSSHELVRRLRAAGLRTRSRVRTLPGDGPDLPDGFPDHRGAPGDGPDLPDGFPDHRGAAGAGDRPGGDDA